MNTSNNPAAPENNRHHTLSYRSYDEWAEQFDPDPITGEPDEPITKEDIARMAEAEQALLEEFFPDPATRPPVNEAYAKWLEVDDWSDDLDRQQANLKGRVAESATVGRR